MIVGKMFAFVDKVAEVVVVELQFGITVELAVVVDFEVEFQMKSLYQNCCFVVL